MFTEYSVLCGYNWLSWTRKARTFDTVLIRIIISWKKNRWVHFYTIILFYKRFKCIFLTKIVKVTAFRNTSNQTSLRIAFFFTDLLFPIFPSSTYTSSLPMVRNMSPCHFLLVTEIQYVQNWKITSPK